jgi:hypothetical protein
MKTNLIQSVLGCILISLVVSGCASTAPKPEVVTIQTRPVDYFPPIVPRVDDLQLREVEWIVVTEQNIQGVLMRLRDAGQEPVLYALSSDGYVALISNQADIMKLIRQQREVIAVYRDSYKR